MNERTVNLVRLIIQNKSELALKMYMACELYADENGLVDFSARKFMEVWGGSLNNLKKAFTILEDLGLIENYRPPGKQHISCRLIPVEQTKIYQNCLKNGYARTTCFAECVGENSSLGSYSGSIPPESGSSLESHHGGENSSLGSYSGTEGGGCGPVPNTIEIKCASKSVDPDPKNSSLGSYSGILPPEGDSSLGSYFTPKIALPGAKALSRELDIIYKYNTSHISSHISSHSNSHSVALSRELFSERTMELAYKVSKIWKSWNQFAKNQPNLKPTPMPPCLKPEIPVKEPNDNSMRRIYEQIAKWVDNNPDWEELWAYFMETAENNTWLQGKEGFPVTLAWLFRATGKDGEPLSEGSGLERAITGKYSKWDKQITANLNEDGSLKAEAAIKAEEEIKKSGMKIFGKVEND